MKIDTYSTKGPYVGANRNPKAAVQSQTKCSRGDAQLSVVIDASAVLATNCARPIVKRKTPKQ